MIREALQILTEANTLTIYHGDNFGTKRIDSKLMMNGNVQEGPGIYFGTLETAQTYGKDVVYAEVDPKKFIPSRGTVGRYLKLRYDLMKILHKVDPEPLWYDLTDWGQEIENPEDVKLSDLRFLSEQVKNDEVRNFLIGLAQSFGPEELAKAWLKVYPNKLGTYNSELEFYAIINTKVFLRPYKEEI